MCDRMTKYLKPIFVAIAMFWLGSAISYSADRYTYKARIVSTVGNKLEIRFWEYTGDATLFIQDYPMFSLKGQRLADGQVRFQSTDTWHRPFYFVPATGGNSRGKFIFKEGREGWFANVTQKKLYQHMFSFEIETYNRIEFTFWGKTPLANIYFNGNVVLSLTTDEPAGQYEGITKWVQKNPRNGFDPGELIFNSNGDAIDIYTNRWAKVYIKKIPVTD